MLIWVLVKVGSFCISNQWLIIYSIVPQIDHYGCVVDFLGRAGLLDKALSFIRKMPIEPDAVIWAALLRACRIYKNFEIAELAHQRLIELEPKNPANFDSARTKEKGKSVIWRVYQRRNKNKINK